jgi:hypothetical protein
MAGLGESEIESFPSFGQLQGEQFIQSKQENKHVKEKIRPRFVN